MQAILQEVRDPEGRIDALATRDADEDVEPGPRDATPEQRRQVQEMRKDLRGLDRQDELTALASQDATTEREIRIAQRLQEPGVPNGPTTYDQLRGIPQGTFFYEAQGVPLAGGGNYDFVMNVDLGAQTFGGGGSRLQVNGSRAGVQALPTPVSFAGSQGLANFHINTNAITGAGCGTNCSANLAVLPQNEKGKVAAAALHSVRVYDMGGTLIDQGAGKTGRQPGFKP